MKTLFVGINAKFIHSNLAIRYIQKYAQKQGVTIHTTEYTINQPIDLILDGILSQSPDLVGFSCYLWNIEMVKKLVEMLKQVRPELSVLLGGPEVSYDTRDIMDEIPGTDYIVSGEGERTATALVGALAAKNDITGIPSLTYRNDEAVHVNSSGVGMAMDEVPFVYDVDLEGLEHRIIYYETSRGCPYKCQYCLSSIERGVRFRSMNLVHKELQFFLDQKVSQVKFVDRTFNAKKEHTLSIWRYLHENDNGVTNFHFEITADLLDDATIDFLKDVRPGLLQFEVGVQSTHEPTILAVERQVDFERVKDKVLKVMEGGNIHMHLDLIAGLPKEDYKTFGKSFNDVIAIQPDQLQLGFLKVLKGSPIHRLQNEYGIVYRSYAPYEVLMTKEMSYEDLRRLKNIEALLETYYNSHQFSASMAYLMDSFESPFTCFEAMTDVWLSKGSFLLPHSKLGLYELLYKFGCELDIVDSERLKAYLIHDLCMREKPKKWPAFVEREEKLSDVARGFYQNEVVLEKLLKSYKGYSSKQISRMAHLEAYGYNVLDWNKEGASWVLYDYRDRHVMTGYATATDVTQWMSEVQS